MSKIVTTIAVLMFAFAATASAQVSQDFRSPDARPATAAQDYRSPDAQRPIATRTTYGGQSLSSPDARPTGRFLPPVPGSQAAGSDAFQWGYLAVAIAAVLAAIAALTITQRRRRHGLVIGS